MGWTAPITWTAGQVVGATDLNTQIRDNFLYQEGGQPSPTVNRNNAGNYTTTSTSFVDVDATNLILTATVNSGRFRVEATFSMTIGDNTNSVLFDGIVDSVTRSTGGDTNFGVNGFGPSTNWGVPYPITVIMEWTGLSVGSHTFKLQWRVTGSTGTIYANNKMVKMVGWEY